MQHLASGMPRTCYQRCTARHRSIGLLMLLVACLLAGCAGAQLMPTPNIYLQAAANPFVEVAPPLRTNTVEVLYATDRQAIRQEDGTLAYGSERSASLAYGSGVVEIGDHIPWETLVEQSLQRERSQKLPLHLRTVTEYGRFPATPLPIVRDNGHFRTAPAAQAAQDQMAEKLRQTLRERLALTSRKDAYVYIHGFNNNFADAMFVIADLWHFMGRQGVPIVYTWPAGAGGALRGYTHDRESGEFTIFHLKQFLRILASTPELEHIHLIAHSRGTDVATTALRELVIETRAVGREARAFAKLSNVVLAAADLDMEVVSQRLAAERIGLDIDRITIYVSQADRALGMSGCLFVSLRRVGQIRPEDLTAEQRQDMEVSGRTYIIDARVSAGFVGHSYFYAHPAVSADLILLLRDNLDPGSPGRPLYKRDVNFWQITEEYPAAPPGTSR
jgi:esterase/lipase superfamily enzyme